MFLFRFIRNFEYHNTGYCISLNTLAGEPTAIVLSGMSFVTTLPAPIIAFSPTVTPATMVTFAPIQAFRFISIGAERREWRISGFSG